MAEDGARTPAGFLRSIRETDVPALLKALVLGVVGGAVFAALNLPLPWMLGAMLFTSAAAVAGARIVVPIGLRSIMVVVLGIMLGSAFDPWVTQAHVEYGNVIIDLNADGLADAASATNDKGFLIRWTGLNDGERGYVEVPDWNLPTPLQRVDELGGTGHGGSFD